MKKETKSTTTPLPLPATDSQQPYLVEVAWEVCNQIGGIYTVVRSKVPTMVKQWGENYCLIGPYIFDKMPFEFEPIDTADDCFFRAAVAMRQRGFEVHYGKWLVSGEPKVILINPKPALANLEGTKFALWQDLQIPTINADPLLDQVIAFADILNLYLGELAKPTANAQKKLIAHFHEWMTALPILTIKKNKWAIKTVFTTHATIIGRYMAMNDNDFYEKLPFVDWLHEAQKYGVQTQVIIERQAALQTDVFTTVSEVTARECVKILGRTPDVITPNGLNIKRFTALHEFQNLHQRYKEKIENFVRGHFFNSYSFDLDKTLYFFTSGRFEYRNKGFDLTIDALKQLNTMLKKNSIDTTVVLFFITKQPYSTMNPKVLESIGMLKEIENTCEAILQQIRNKFYNKISEKPENLPNLNEFIDDYWKLRLRRTLHAWKTDQLPAITTHLLKDRDNDQIVNGLTQAQLLNAQTDRVKVVYHPDFISPMNPLFGMEYGQFVRGCHLGVFPSYYEPWGYTPQECIVGGVPAVTSDLSGFGTFMSDEISDREGQGVYIIKRRDKSYNSAVNQLTHAMFDFVKQDRTTRIIQRNRAENLSDLLGWDVLSKYYKQAYDLALS